MFWYVVLGVVIVLFALAWWSSGRSKGLGRKQFDGISGSEHEGAVHRQGQVVRNRDMGGGMHGPMGGGLGG